MKVPATLILAYLAAAGTAAPVEARDDSGLFFGDGNIFGSIFDSFSCVISAFLGGRTPLCFNGNNHQGDGQGLNVPTASTKGGNEPTVSASQIAQAGYNFNYETNNDGSYHITIKPNYQGKQPCDYNVSADGKDVKTLVQDAAKKCFA